MTRLTKRIKEKICRKAIEQSPVNKALAEVNSQLSKLTLDVYNDNATNEQIEDMCKIVERVKKLPFNFRGFFETSYIKCVFGGMYTNLYTPDGVIFYDLKENPTYTAEHEFTKRFLDLEHKKDSLIKQKNDLKLEIQALLDRCATLKKLQQIWPESVNFLGSIETDIAIINLPAVVIEDLNNKLGISS